MDKNYTQKELKESIKKEYIDDNTYYYNLARKEQKNFSLFKNDRLLVLDFEEGKLFYVNQTRKLPFRSTPPQPKSGFAVVNATRITHLRNTNIITFEFKYENEQYAWKFEFQTNEVADQWMKLFQFQKQSKQTKEKDLKALNKAIFEMPKIEKEQNDDIVKQPQRNIPNDEVKIINQKRELERSRHELSSENNRNKKNNYKDWNERFYNNRDFATLHEYRKFAVDSFYSSLKKDPLKSKGLRTYQNESVIVKIANRFTPEAKKLKNEYRNYHFITQATNKEFVIGVPLCCLVEFQQLVSLVKARFPDRVEKINYQIAMKEHFNELQRYTRIKNKVLQNRKFLNLADNYDSRRDYLIYIDDVTDYLPMNLEFPNEETLVRPEYMLDNVDYFIYSTTIENKVGNQTDTRQMKQLTYRISQKVKIFSQKFYEKHFAVCRISELKDILHQAGLNLKYLPNIYSACPNIHVKKHLYSAMTAKIVKDYIFQNLIKIKSNDDNASLEKIFEQTLGILLSGNNNRSHELWKEISLIFKKKYNILLNNKQLVPGFFFNSLLELVPANIDIKKINKRKKIFEQTKILQPGFIKNLIPKVKCFDRYLTPYIQAVKIDAKEEIKSEDTCKNILKELFNEKNRTYDHYYEFGKNDEWMLSYLSLYYPPQNIASDKETKIKYLFDRINEEPPSYHTLTLTKNYLEWCIKKQNVQQFKRVFETAIQISDYWLDEVHPMRSDLLEILSDYYSIQGLNDEMIKYMKDALIIANKFWGQNSPQTGLKLYELADRYLRMCRKKEAIEYFHKAKENMEQNKTKTNKVGLTYMKLASIYLSDLEYEKAIEYAQISNKSFEEYERKVNSYGIYNQPYKIKAYEVLARVYQICDKRPDYKQLALNCARKFNNTKNEEVFQQMIRICLASVIFKSNVDRCESFLKLAKNLDEQNRSNEDRSSRSPRPIEELIRLSQQVIVMQKFIYKYEFMQRSLFEVNSKKRGNLAEDSHEFLFVLKNIIKIVGIEYLKGLVEEKISYGN